MADDLQAVLSRLRSAEEGGTRKDLAPHRVKYKQLIKQLRLIEMKAGK
jgi:hypothetical protein